MRKNISSGAKWEAVVGYSRAVVVDNLIEIAGTVSTDENGVVGKGDAYRQTHYIITKAKMVLEQAGFALSDVVRTRIFVTDIKQWEQIGRAHGEFFREIRPVTSMVQVAALIDPDYLVEIEFTAARS
ncbi:MAG: RidA family protein [Cyclobacteriaceae bacterium]|nr:RidA family protein [Cyclobacteriaceae bacterium]